MTFDKDSLLKKRDVKAIPHLEQYAPVWVTDEKIIEEDESVQFHAVFHHNLYGWVSRRYRYDGFNNVLYHKGQTELPEDEAVDLMENDPYIDATVSNIPNAYGG